MIFEKTNIESKLQKVRKKQEKHQGTASGLEDFLNGNSMKQAKISAELASKSNATDNRFNLDLLETTKIYHLDQIKEICIDYRLRFLDSSYFKGEIPKTALKKIQQLEREHEVEIKGYKIMAPSKLFKLEDKDDPLLFAPIGNDYFYLIHKWGNDLHPLRKLLVWPFKNIGNLVLFVLLISYLTTLLIPDGLFSKNNSSAEFWLIFFFMFKWIASLVIFYGFARGKNFNPVIWNSKYFNA
ncbi:hypothetical protein [Flagellimonas nanhaiensis]|uniref:Uncharacterized protein n=1 Tax=Flagellimonas nanhaiensis TaxID=2292706 RepID=A0A371JWB1_9FLAO|nr:hypothetical protein [Allomuricauda nanhaiensis]RDY62032.1 hypothetical protein DX873_04130 [Allomuricauda nanhaiensis]